MGRNRPRGTIRLTHLDSGMSFREWLTSKIGHQSRGDLASRIGVSRTRFNNWAPVNGNSTSNNPDYNSFVKIVEYFGENPNDFHRQGTPMSGEIKARKNEILRCYSEMGMSAEEIAPYFETSPRAIGCVLEDNEKLTQDQKNDAKIAFERNLPSRHELEEMVYECKFTKPEICELTDVPFVTISRLLKKYGIALIPTLSDEEEKAICDAYASGNVSLRSLAKKYNRGADTLKQIILNAGGEIRDSRFKDKKWEERRLEAVRAALAGVPISNEQKRKLAEARNNSPGGRNKVFYKGEFYDSKEEAAVANVFGKYLPWYEAVRGETFQRVSDKGHVFDFIFPGRVVEWHPSHLVYDSKLLEDGDYEAFEELRRECPKEKGVLNKMVLEDINKLYEQKRIEDVARDSSVGGYDLTVLRSFEDLYSILSEYNERLPPKSVVRGYFNQIKEKARYVETAEEAAA